MRGAAGSALVAAGLKAGGNREKERAVADWSRPQAVKQLQNHLNCLN